MHTVSIFPYRFDGVGSHALYFTFVVLILGRVRGIAPFHQFAFDVVKYDEMRPVTSPCLWPLLGNQAWRFPLFDTGFSWICIGLKWSWSPIG